MKTNKQEWAAGASRVWLGSTALILLRRATGIFVEVKNHVTATHVHSLPFKPQRFASLLVVVISLAGLNKSASGANDGADIGRRVRDGQ